MNHLIGSDKSFYIFKANNIKRIDYSNGKICFAPIVKIYNNKPFNNYCLKKIKMTIKFFKTNCDENVSLSNKTLLNKDELIIWFESLKQVFDYDYSLFDVDKDFYLMDINIESANKVQFLWLMTGIRSVYEKVGALVIRDVFTLISDGVISSNNIINIFKIFFISMCFENTQTWYSSMFLPKLMTKEEQSHIVTHEALGSCRLTTLESSSFKNNTRTSTSYVSYSTAFCDLKSPIKRYKKLYLPTIKLYKTYGILTEDIIYEETV
jgi:hypothetical protein